MNSKQGSQPKYRVLEQKNVMVSMRDGIRLASDIYRPDTRGKFPALLAMCPYSKDVQAAPIPPQPRRTALWNGGLEAGNSEYLVSRGYVHVVVDVRGTGKSEGEWLNLYSRKEQEDGYDLVEWIARQDWCDGNVGMVGISYFACIQFLVAALQPPHLKAIFPLDGWTDTYRHIAYHGGMLDIGFFAPYLYSLTANTGCVSATQKTVSGEELERLLQAAKKNPDIQINSFLMLILEVFQKNPMMFDFLLNPTDGPFYWERSPYTKFDKIKIPVYLGAPWDQYLMHLPGAFSAYRGIDAPKKLLIVPHDFDRPWYEYHDVVVRWFDHWLKGMDTGIMDEAPIRIFVMGANRWRDEQEWPLARTQWTKFYLLSREQLLPEPAIYRQGPPYYPEPDCFVHQPPTATSGVPSLKYLTPPLPEDTEVTGPIVLTLFASIDTDDTNWIVSLKDVSPGGAETLLTQGWLKASHRAIDQSKSTPWEPFHPHTNPAPVKSGEIVEYQIGLQPISNVFRAGHRIKLEITTSDYKGAYMHMETHFYHLPSSKTTLHKVYYDSEHRSCLVLPIIG
jgi:putative CocE/NonD family hydrolase